MTILSTSCFIGAHFSTIYYETGSLFAPPCTLGVLVVKYFAYLCQGSLTSVALWIWIATKFNNLFTGPLPIFPQNFMQIQL